MPWFSMTATYLWREGDVNIRKYERRITICSAPDEETATENLLREAKEYPLEGIELLDDFYIQEIDTPPCTEPVEVAHEMSLGIDPVSGKVIEPDEFQRTQFGCSRIEDCDTLGIEHSWYNHDGEQSACHNCKIIRKGRLWPKLNPTKQKAEQDGAPDS